VGELEASVAQQDRKEQESELAQTLHGRIDRLTDANTANERAGVALHKNQALETEGLLDEVNVRIQFFIHPPQ
jgi:hypothetical protein